MLVMMSAVQCKLSATDAEVNAVHADICKAIHNLYEQHKHLMPGWERRPLSVT